MTRAPVVARAHGQRGGVGEQSREQALTVSARAGGVSTGVTITARASARRDDAKASEPAGPSSSGAVEASRLMPGRT